MPQGNHREDYASVSSTSNNVLGTDQEDSWSNNEVQKCQMLEQKVPHSSTNLVEIVIFLLGIILCQGMIFW